MFIHTTPLSILKKRWKVILLVGLIFALFSLVISLFFPLDYRADAQVLIISKSRYGVDPYTVVKSSERVGENLIQVIKTDDFFNKVMSQSGYNLDKSKFINVPNRTRRKRWNKTIQTSVVYGTGMLNLSAFQKDPKEAKQLVSAVANALSAEGWQYVGGDVTIKVVNDPIVTPWPVRPNLILNVILAFVVGMLLMGLLIFKKEN